MTYFQSAAKLIREQPPLVKRWTRWRVYWQDEIAWLNRHGHVTNDEALRLTAMMKQVRPVRRRSKAAGGKRRRSSKFRRRSK